MRLLNTETGLLEHFDDPRRVSYAILSHVWAKKGYANFVPELEFQDIPTSVPRGARRPREWLTEKVQRACKIARKHGYKYIWIDTCCINKVDSAELSESINSMYNWYRWADLCYVILDDAEPSEIDLVEDKLRDSRWFTRGWTLQELIAPPDVLFLYKDWTPIGSKYALADILSRITNIDSSVLKHEKPLSDVSVAERMSWASERETTKEEDKAYCLFGIFDVHLPPIYGEGRSAFTRLQEAILRRIPDQTIFAWGKQNNQELSLQAPSEAQPSLSVKGSAASFLLASCPNDFRHSNRISHISPEALAKDHGLPHLPYPDFTVTAYGIRAVLPLVDCFDRAGNELRVALLACKTARGEIVGLVLRSAQPPPRDAEMLVGAAPSSPRAVDATRPYHSEVEILSSYFRLAAFPINSLRTAANTIRTSDIYVRHHLQSSQHSPDLDDIRVNRMLWEALDSDDNMKMELHLYCKELLQYQGYDVADQYHDRRISLRCSDGDGMTVDFGRCKCEDGRHRGYIRLRIIPSGEVGATGAQLAASGGLEGCSGTHVIRWTFNNGRAYTTFKHLGSGSTVRQVWAALKLANTSNPAKRLYILYLNISTSPVTQDAVDVRGHQPPGKSTKKAKLLKTTLTNESCDVQGSGASPPSLRCRHRNS